MSTPVLLLGYLFWTGMAFAGARSKFAQEDAAPAWPVRSVPAGAIGIAVGLGAVVIETRRVAAMAGLIGPFFALGVGLGVLGAVTLAAGLASGTEDAG